MSVPLDIKTEWMNIARRMQAEVSRNQGYALVTVSILVNERNVPVAWGEPVLKRIEPCRSAGDALMLIAKELCQTD